MANFWVTFRLSSDASYDRRYSEMMEALRAEDKGFWSDTTSFCLVESSVSIDALTKRATKPLNSTADAFLIKELDGSAARYFGQPTAVEVLLSFIPGLKKV